MSTHEQFVHSVAALAIARLNADETLKAQAVKLVYGSGPSGTRGVTFYSRWKKAGQTDAVPFVEVSAFGQESWVQVAGTTIHELGHVLAGWSAAHGKDWKAACERLGLRRIKAAGTRYCLAMFAPDLRNAIAMLPRPSDGEPVSPVAGMVGAGPLGPVTVKGCNVGIGTRGGKSRGKGSGSRLRLWECECDPPVKARVSSDRFRAHCDCCSGAFKLRV